MIPFLAIEHYPLDLDSLFSAASDPDARYAYAMCAADGRVQAVSPSERPADLRRDLERMERIAPTREGSLVLLSQQASIDTKLALSRNVGICFF